MINFKTDSGECEVMPYVELRKTESGVVAVEIVRKIF